ncbi:MAG TPA: MBL fold metallo-hydrolase [Thermoanaerobaculia bacterium]|nr:MBL fold metallo-hydrolase [Thermoanaerobaculia bacterium]
MRKAFRITAILALAALPAVAQDRDFSKVEIKAVPVAGNVHMLQGAGGNIGVSVGKDGLLIVDDQFAPLADKIKAALKGLGEGKLEFVLNTHWHGDHTGGNEVFGREAPIIAHDNVRKRMAAGQIVRGSKIDPAPPGALPVLTFGESVSIHFNGEEIKAIHFPKGHTDGDSVIFFTGANVVHMGDQFFTGRFPFVDLESGGTVQGLTENVGKVLAQIPADAKVIPGHGALSTVEDLKAYHRMLVETTDVVKKGMAAGKTLEQIQTEGLPEPWKEWGSGFINTENWIATIHASFSPGAHAHTDGTHH